MVKLFACGVNEYRGEMDLPFCVNDSIAFCEAFKENLIIDEKDIYIVTDNGNISNIEYCKALKAFCEEATEKDTLVVFHSGHGGVDENTQKLILNWEKFIMNVIIVVSQCHLVNIRNFAIEA